MKKFAQFAVLIAGLAGLSACATSDADSMEGRTAGGDAEYVNDLQICNERVRRLEEMNKACYRK